MIVDAASGDLVLEIGDDVAAWVDHVVPAGVEPLDGNRYSPRYAWMFTYERQVKQRLELKLGRRLGTELERRLFGPDGVVSEALSNAFVHGHRRDPELAIEVLWRVGRSGVICTVRDAGHGFDVADSMRRLAAGSAYYHFAGNGIRALSDTPGVVAAFADGGRTTIVGVRYEP